VGEGKAIFSTQAIATAAIATAATTAVRHSNMCQRLHVYTFTWVWQCSSPSLDNPVAHSTLKLDERIMSRHDRREEALHL
jgi:hypothetical protein